MKNPLIVAAGLAALALAACEQQSRHEGDTQAAASKPETGEARFQYSLSEDASGEYAPLETVLVGDWGLEHIFISGPHSFERLDVESWGQAQAAPLTMVLSSANGGLTVAPARFEISDSRVRFEGSSPATGDYRFEGRMDLDALAKARRTLGSEEAVLNGKLRIGGQTFNNLSFKIKTGG